MTYVCASNVYIEGEHVSVSLISYRDRPLFALMLWTIIAFMLLHFHIFSNFLQDDLRNLLFVRLLDRAVKVIV